MVAIAALGAVGTERQPTPTSVPAGRNGHVMAAAADGSHGVYVLGAVSAGDAFWLLRDRRWMSLTQNGPVTRTMAAMAVDTKRRRLVVFGGVGVRNGSRYGDTWEFDGQAWKEMDVRSPGARDHHAMAYDEARGQMVMYGGWNLERVFTAETWTWDGTTWTRAEETGAPGGRGHHAMAYDSRRQRVVMFGGDTPDRPADADVWEWDGTRWERIAAPNGPGARTRHRLAYDAARGVTVLFGGQIGSGRESVSTGDTWTWDGKAWTRFDVPGPGPRGMPAMAYDSAHERVVLFGGNSASGPYRMLGDTWAWDGTKWAEVK